MYNFKMYNFNLISPLAHAQCYYSYPPIKICVAKLRDALQRGENVL